MGCSNNANIQESIISKEIDKENKEIKENNVSQQIKLSENYSKSSKDNNSNKSNKKNSKQNILIYILYTTLYNDFLKKNHQKKNIMMKKMKITKMMKIMKTKTKMIF